MKLNLNKQVGLFALGIVFLFAGFNLYEQLFYTWTPQKGNIQTHDKYIYQVQGDTAALMTYEVGGSATNLDSLIAILTDIWDSGTSTGKVTVLNLNKYEAIAHTVDTSSSTVGANHYEIIDMEGYRNLDISIIATDATGMQIQVYRTYDANASTTSTTGWYNCTNEFFGSGATLTLTGTDQTQDGTSAEMMPLKYMIWYSAGATGNSLDIFTRKHTKR